MRPPLILTTLSLGLVGLLLLLFFMEEVPWWLDEDARLLEQHCGACHEADYPRAFAKPPVGWANTVEQMLSSANGSKRSASARERARITALLQRRRSADGETLLHRRCGKCHDLDLLDPYLALDRAALSLLVRQHCDQNNHAIQVWERRLIEPVIMARRDAVHPAAPGKDEAAGQLKYERSCGGCHTVRFRYRSMCELVPPGSWGPVITRMGDKAPRLIPPADLPGLTARARAICANGGVLPAP